jgi:shikimate kinase
VGTLWLVGMMGSGKSAVGRAAAERLGEPFVDLDEEITAAAGRPISAVFADEGEACFRAAEAEAVAAVAGRRAVVAVGGGAVLTERSRRLMRETGTVVWLDAEVGELVARVGGGQGRPLLAGPDTAGTLAALAAERRPAYRAAAHHRVETSGRGLDEVVEEVTVLWSGS